MAARPPVARLLAAVVLSLVVGACTHPDTPAATPPDELARFHDQELEFGPCADYATTALDEQVFAIDPRFECARLEVPLDHAEPDGATAQIALLRVPARGETIGSLLLDSGGPGGPGMAFAAALSRTLATSPITERFDLVGFDPRGVGASTPTIDCYTPDELASGAVQNEFVVSAGAWTEADTTALVEQCAQRSGGDATLASIGTRDVARDMDVLREVLGDRQLSSFGQSYGTRLGSLYAQQFPDRVRAMVPSALYSQQDWPRLAAALTEVRSGRGDELRRIGEEFAGEGNDGEATYAIACRDEERLTPEEAVDLRAAIYAATPILDPGLGTAGARDGCESWPAAPELTYPFPDGIDGLPPTLTISITGDPSTPYGAGLRLAEALGGSLLTVDGEQHTVLSAGTSPCVDDIAAAYLVDLVPPPDGARCSL